MPHDAHDDHSELGEMDVRVRALQTVLAQKGYIELRPNDLSADGRVADVPARPIAKAPD